MRTQDLDACSCWPPQEQLELNNFKLFKLDFNRLEQLKLFKSVELELEQLELLSLWNADLMKLSSSASLTT